MGDPTRGITDPNMRNVIKDALAKGWEWAGWNGGTHGVIRWPATGERVVFGGTPGTQSYKHTAHKIKNVSGIDVVHKGNKRRSRKAVELSGFSIDKARYEAKHRKTLDPNVADDLFAEREELIERAIGLCRDGRRVAVRQVPPALRRIDWIESELMSAGRCTFRPFKLDCEMQALLEKESA